MVSNRLRGLSARWISCWVAVIYGVGATLYVIVSDRLLGYLINNPARLAEFQTYKTLLLVVASAVVVYELAYRAMRPRYQAAPVARTASGNDSAASLRAHINWLILAVAAPLAVLLAYLIYVQARDDAAAARASVQAGARIVAADTGRFFATAQQKMKVVAERTGARSGLVPCDPAFEYFSVLNPEFTVLLLWSVDGAVQCPADRRGVRYDDARRPPWLGEVIASRRALVSEPYRGPLSGRWISVIAQPVISPAGRLVGVLDLSVDLGNFSPVSVPVGGGVEVLVLLDGRGRVAASASAQGDAGREDGEISPVAMSRRDGHEVSRGADGIERIYGFAPVVGTDWVAVAGMPVDLVFEKAHHRLVGSTLLALAIVLGASYFSYRVSLRIERPIIITARTAQAVAAGDTSARAPLIGPAETRVVARQFNAMLDGRDKAELALAALLEQERAARAEAERAHREIEALREGLESEVANRTRELVTRNRELQAFSYTVSHDLRAPLRRIGGFAAVLEESLAGRLGAREQECLGNISAAVERMDALTDGLLKLSRISRYELMPVQVDLGALAHEVIDELRRADPGRIVVVNIDCDARVLADTGLMRSLLQNLLGNAWKYTAGKDAASIVFEARRNVSGDLEYCVRDNGAGFDMASATRLFEPFARMHHEAQFPGTGIGLATGKRIVERHGGTIRIESAPDAGTSVHFTLGSVIL